MQRRGMVRRTSNSRILQLHLMLRRVEVCHWDEELWFSDHGEELQVCAFVQADSIQTKLKASLFGNGHATIPFGVGFRAVQTIQFLWAQTIQIYQGRMALCNTFFAFLRLKSQHLALYHMWQL